MNFNPGPYYPHSCSRYGVTVIGIRRGGETLTSPHASDTLHAGNIILVMGSAAGAAERKRLTSA